LFDVRNTGNGVEKLQFVKTQHLYLHDLLSKSCR
jgi:hypothetical protein